jgi:hypothetical protein
MINQTVRPLVHWKSANPTLYGGQTSDARTYHQWQEVSRFVKKGSSAFPIFAPITKKVKDETDPDKDKVLLLGFKLLPVFKIEDTDGEPLPEYDYTPPSTAVSTKLLKN